MYTCRVRGHPSPSVSWEKDDLTIKENNHFKISVHGDEHILEILNTTKSDEGLYTCRLQNPNGKTSHTATLVVKERADFRSVLKTRSNLRNLGRQDSDESPRSAKELSQVDFRQVLRKGDKSAPPGGHTEKPKHSGVQQVDFRNVLKARTDKHETVLSTRSKTTESVRESVILKSSDTSKKVQDSNKDSSVITKTLQHVSLQNPLNGSDMNSSKMDVKNSLNTSSSLKAVVGTEESKLKNKLNKFENLSNKESPPSVPSLRNDRKLGNGLLNRFEDSDIQRDSFGLTSSKTGLDKSELRSSHTLPKRSADMSVLQRLNKFEQMSSSHDNPSKTQTPPLSHASRPRPSVLDKYSINCNQNSLNGKSNKSEIVTRYSSPEASLKSRKEKFEQLSDSVPEKPRQSKPETIRQAETLPKPSWRSKSENLSVKTTRQPPQFHRQLADQRVRYGHQAVLECEVSNGTVDWQVNGRSIKCSKFFKMTMTPENVATLTIAEAYSEDEGEYVCTATNKFGSVSSSCRLVVEASSSLSSRSDIEGAVTIPTRLLNISPSTLAVLTGQNVVIKATFTGEPKPEVRWFKGREELQKNERIDICNSVDETILTILDADAADAGKYIVAVENHASRDSLSASVSVEDVPEPPGAPQANDIMSSSIMLWWCGPPYDGGSQITHYKVQMKKVGDFDWTTVTDGCKNTFYQIGSLEGKTPYYFRVFAANKHGFSRAGEESGKIFTSDEKLSIDYESDDELPFEPREVKIESGRKFEDHYEVLHEVGKGKFGYVYQCKDKQSGKIWAAKILKCREKEKANIRHEIEIMNELAHPKLMMIWDAFEASRCMTLVMEFVGGGELFERVISDDFELTEGDCVHFMRQICDGVGYMHEHSILHLDLKPENILCISENTNQVKIIDFGLARRYEEGKTLKVLFGTPEFIAPEVINYDEISFATDMWSLGVICYLLLSGLSPFLGDSDAETLANVTLGDYDFDDEQFDDITQNAKDFITRLLIKNKGKRNLIKQAQQHVWLAQDERRIRNKRLNTERLKKFMARRKWQVYDETESCSVPSDGTKNTQEYSTPVSHSRPRETTATDKGESTLYSVKKTCSDHNGNIENPKHNGYKNPDVDSINGEITPPNFLKEMIDCEAFTGDVIRFDVRVAGSPELEFHWLHEDEEVQEDRRHIVENSDNGQCSLIIRNVNEEDEGEYSCVAVNQAGESSCSAELIICSLGAL